MIYDSTPEARVPIVFRLASVGHALRSCSATCTPFSLCAYGDIQMRFLYRTVLNLIAVHGLHNINNCGLDQKAVICNVLFAIQRCVIASEHAPDNRTPGQS